MKKFEKELELSEELEKYQKPVFSIGLLEDEVELRRKSEYCTAVCVDKDCTCEDCPRLWAEPQKVKEAPHLEFPGLDLDLGQGKSQSIVNSFFYACREILCDYSSENAIHRLSEKSTKSRKKKVRTQRKKKISQKHRDLRPFLESYRQKWQTEFNHSGMHLRNRLVLNPLIFGGLPAQGSNLLSEKTHKICQFPNSAVKLPSEKLDPCKSHSRGADPVCGLRSPRPRFSFKHRRKSSLLSLDSPEEEITSALELRLCPCFLQSGFCLQGKNCCNLHGFRRASKYQHLLRRFRNVLVSELARVSSQGLAALLNRFHSLQPPLPVFQKLLFRRPETCVFDLLK